MAGERELEYSYSLDNANLKRDADEAKNVFKSISDAVEKESVKIDNAFERGVSEANKNIKSLGVTLKKDSDGITEYFNTISSAVEVNKQVISELEAEYKRLGEQISGMRKSKKKSALVEEYESIGAVINTAKGSLSAFEAENSKMSRGYKELGKELSNVQSELMRMRSAGQQNTQEYRNLEQEAAKLSSTISGVQSNVRKLANERSTVQGLTEGLRGLTGAFALGSGVVGLFSKENQNLEKIMVRLQSAMSIAIGLQEVSNALDKNSAFQTVALTKAKTLYTASLGRLSVALGISTAAAQALMAALTLGLSAAIGVAIVAWDKYSKKQEEAAKKIKDRLEIEKEGYATMLKTRFELDNATKSIDKFNGTKEEEKNKVEELNKKYGESFGYYNTLDDWYNALIKKGDDYVNSLFLQIKAQNLLTKAVEADERARQIAAEGVQTGDFKWYDVVNPLNSLRGGAPSASAAMRANQSFQDRLKKENESREEYLKEARELEKERADLLSGAAIGGFRDTRKADARAGNKAETERHRIAKEIAERKVLIDEYENNVIKMLADSEMRIRDARINNMDDGYDKEIARIDYNYKRLIAENEKQEAEMLKALTKARELEYRNLNPKDKMPFTKTFSREDLSEAELNILTENERVANETRVRAEKDLQKKITEEFDKGFEARKKIAEDFSKDEIRRAETDSEIARIILSSKIYNTEAAKRRDELLTDLIELEKKLDSLQKKQEESNTQDAADDIVILTERIKALNKEIDKTKADEFSEILGKFQGVAGAMASIGGDIGAAFGGISSEIGNISKAFDSGTSPMNQYAIAIESVIKLIGMVIEASKKRKEAEKQFYIDALSYAHQYALALNEQLRNQSKLTGGGFVRDYASEINDAFSAMTEAVNGYQNALDKLAEGQAKIKQKNAIDAGNVGKGIGSGAAAGAAIGAIAGAGVLSIPAAAIGAAIGAVVGGIVGLFAKKKKDVFGGLLEVYPELINGQDELNEAMAKSLLSSNQLDDKTKQLVQNALDWADAVKEADTAINDIVVELAGDLGNSMRSAIVDAWKAGEDASKRMFDVAGESLSKFLEQLIWGAMFSDIFEDFRNEIKSVFKGDSNINFIDAFGNLLDNLEEKDNDFIKVLEDAQKLAAQRGIELWGGGDTRTGISKGLQGMTQDTADELNGRFTVIQGHTFVIANTMPLLLENSNVANGHLFAIRENTARLESIENFMRRNTEASEDIRDRGIKML